MEKHKTKLAKQHIAMWHALMNSSENDEYRFALYSCTVNGKPTAAIVCITYQGDELTIVPLFIAVTKGMTIIGHDGQSAEWSEVQ